MARTRYIGLCWRLEIMAVDLEKTVIKCSTCPKTASVKLTPSGAPRTPVGWKRIGEQALCRDCKSKTYRLRAVSFPVARVIGGEWKDFSLALRDAWGRSTRLANWAVRQLLLADSERKADEEKISAMPKVNLYKLWQENCERGDWTGGASSANAILHAVEAKYRKKRYEVIWLNSDQPPRHKFPLPYPVHNKDYTLSYAETEGEDGQKMQVPVVICNLGGKRWTIQLRSGFQFKKQMNDFADLMAGGALKGELAIYRRRSNGSHRRTASDKVPGGGQRTSYRIMVKIVGHFLRTESSRKTLGSLVVRTGKKALLVAVCAEDKKPWLYHADFLRRVIYEYERKRQNISDDMKAENRPASKALRERTAKMAYRQKCRLDTEVRRMAAMLVNYAVRRKVGRLEYSDDDQRYFQVFPWNTLRDYVSQACDKQDVEFVLASGEVVESERSVESDATVDGVNVNLENNQQ